MQSSVDNGKHKDQPGKSQVKKCKNELYIVFFYLAVLQLVRLAII